MTDTYRLYNNPLLGDDVVIQDFAVLGKDGAAPATRRLTIGPRTRILTGAIIYNGCQIGADCLIADHASIRENCTIGDHTVIGRHVCIELDTTIGTYVLIETQAHITGHMTIGDYVFIGPNATTMNDHTMCHPRPFRPYLHAPPLQGPTIHQGARIGAGACILPGITIGEDAVIGAGAVVTKNVPPRTIAIGIPTHPLKPVPPTDLLHLEYQNY